MTECYETCHLANDTQVQRMTLHPCMLVATIKPTIQIYYNPFAQPTMEYVKYNLIAVVTLMT